MDKFEARNQKFETNLKLKAPMLKMRLAARFASVLNFWSFEFVPDFELRISDLLFQDFPVEKRGQVSTCNKCGVAIEKVMSTIET